MRKKVSWYFLLLLTVVAMILVSCQPVTTTTTPTTEETQVITGTTTTTDLAPRETEKPDTTSEEKPQYGGTAIIALSTDLSGFDEVFAAHYLTHTLKLTNQELLQGDWTKGPVGSNQADFILGGINFMNLKTGCLADSWEIPEKGKITFHIREGVYWHNKAPTSGRELTIDDVVFSIQRMCTTPGSYIKNTYPKLASSAVITGDEAARTVTIVCALDEWANSLAIFPDYLSIMPRDAIEKFGDLNDWRNNIGTGPFIMTDYVSAGSVTFMKNNNYWETNPIGPGKGDKLPYLEGVKLLVITDAATRTAAFRTQKIDSLGGEYDDVKEFLDNPNVKSTLYTSDSSYFIGMRTDDPNSPFSKKEVRQALYYATDFNKIKNDYYGGRSIILNWPICYSKENADAYVPMENLPANVQDLFKYNPTRAKELLTGAGYPTMKLSIICYNTATQVDFLSLLKQMWSEVGIELTLDAKEYAVWTQRLRARSFGANELLYTYTSGAWQRLINLRGVTQYNASFINDPKIEELYPQMVDNIGTNDAKVAELNAGLMPYVIEQCWVLSKPTSYSYVVWWKYRKNYNGELYVGYYNLYGYLKYVWTDLALKHEITGK
jgi:peptide/nickel transport system substrate-binding protein